MNKIRLYTNDDKLIYDIENLIAIFVLKSQFTLSIKDIDWIANRYQELDMMAHMQEQNLNADISFEDKEALEIVVLSNDEGIKGVGYHLGGAQDQIVFDFHFNLPLLVQDKPDKKGLKRRLYKGLSPFFTPMSKWGILTGIRPVKIVHECLDKGMTEQEIRQFLHDEDLIELEKIDLLMEIAYRERPHLIPVDENLISLYICIPFCPTRCLYCSFPSNPVAMKGKLIPEYVEKLKQEITVTVEEIKKQGKRIDCVYIGGGTPTVLSEVQLEDLLHLISTQVDLKQVKEFTVEAGRPDTITRQKLQTMKKYGVDRICINPQSMNNHTLEVIGRSHRVEAIKDVMIMAKTIGFKTINMDLIMGLPGEALEDAEHTLQTVIDLEPENVTVHTLAIKRASRLNDHLEEVELQKANIVEDMVHLSQMMLRQARLTPYYMYRQKHMIGQLENVGYALKGHSSLYNMRIMEERHTIVACGAGAVSKLCVPQENRFERVANFKGIEDYLNRFDEVLQRKRVKY